MDHVAGWSQLKDTRITTICDVDLNVTGRASKAIEKRYGSEPNVVQDIRRLLDDKSIDAISVATPNHWHAWRRSGPARPARTSTSRSRSATT